MVRLTVLHQWCAMLMGHGFEAFESVENLLEWRLEEAAELAPSQDSYYREIEDAYEDAAKRFYRYHMCTGLPPGALQPLDDLVPENLLLAEHGDLFARSNPDGTRARRAARQRSLYELARRLGSQEEMHFVIMEHAPPRTIRPEPRPSDKQRIQGGVE